MTKLNRARVVAAALEILETGGSAALTIPALSMKLKIRPPSLYNHIASISDLKRELSVHSARVCCQKVSKAAAGKIRDEALLAIAREYRHFAREHPALYALSVAVPPAADKEWYESFSEFFRIWFNALEGYGMDNLRTRYAGRMFRSMVHGFVDLEVNGGWFEDLDVEQSFEKGLKMLWRGFMQRLEHFP